MVCVVACCYCGSLLKILDPPGRATLKNDVVVRAPLSFVFRLGKDVCFNDSSQLSLQPHITLYTSLF